MQFYEGIDFLMELHFFYLYRHYTLQTVLEEKKWHVKRICF